MPHYVTTSFRESASKQEVLPGVERSPDCCVPDQVQLFPAQARANLNLCVPFFCLLFFFIQILTTLNEKATFVQINPTLISAKQVVTVSLANSSSQAESCSTAPTSRYIA
jgi:hypothetical protein